MYGMVPSFCSAAAAAFWTIVAASVFVPEFEWLPFASALPFSLGDVFVGTNSGEIQHFDRVGGTLIQLLDTGIGDSIGGICFDSDWNLYATLFNSPTKLAVFEPTSGTLVTTTFITTTPPPSFKPEGCTVSSRDEIYVGHLGSSSSTPGDIRRYDRNGDLQQIYAVNLTPVGFGTGNGPTFLDLHCDQCTMSYTESGPVLRRYNVCDDVQLPDFINHPAPVQRYYDLRILPDESVLVADTEFLPTSYSAVNHFDSGAANLHTFDATTYFGSSHHKICVVDLDHVDGGDSFWTAPRIITNQIRRIDTSPPHSDLQTILVVDSATALEVLNPHRCGCAEPPAGMTAWWPFDNSSIAHDIAGGHDGTHVSGPSADDGIVDNSLRFDGANSHVLVPDAPELRFPAFTFTVDFWIHPDLGEVRGTIVRKGARAGGDPIYLGGPGYHIFYQLGHFFVYFSGTTGYLNDISDNFMYHADPEKWTNVAITVGPGTVPGFPSYPYRIELWVDGVLAKLTPMPNVGDPSNFEPLVIGGSDFLGATADHGFDGRLDELEFFPRVLTPAEIQSIYVAGAAGKCKDDLHTNWDKAICVDNNYQQEKVVVDIEVCNYNPTSAAYELSLKTLPMGSSGFGGGCSVDGPQSFDDPANSAMYYPTPKPITVPGGKCKIEKVSLEKPAAFTNSSAVGKVGCYKATLRNMNTGHVKRMNGSVQATAGPCPKVVPFANSDGVAAEVLTLVPGAPITIVIDMVESSGKARQMPLVVTPYDSDMSGESAPLSINGNRPGDSLKTTVMLPESHEKQDRARKARGNITLVVESVSREPFGFQDLILSANLDRNTCGVEPLISVGFRSPMLSEWDLDGDGLANDYEVVAGLSPYEPNQLIHLVQLFELALYDAIECLKLLQQEFTEPRNLRQIGTAVRLVEEGVANLKDDAANSVEPVQSAVDALIMTRNSRRRLHREEKKMESTVDGMKEVQPHIISLTATAGVFVDGLLQILNAGGQETTRAQKQLEKGKVAEQKGDYKNAMRAFKKAAAMRYPKK